MVLLDVEIARSGPERLDMRDEGFVLSEAFIEIVA